MSAISKTEYNKKYYLANREKLLVYANQYRLEHPEWYINQREYVKERYRITREAVLDKYGSKCNSPDCRWLNTNDTQGCNDRGILQIDHINGCGYEERKKTKSLTFLKKVLADTDGLYQLLCPNCNWLKKISSALESPSIHTPARRAAFQESLV